MRRKVIYGAPVTSICFLPTFWRHGRSRLGERQRAIQIAWEIYCSLVRYDQSPQYELGPIYTNDIPVGQCSDLVLCGSLGSNAQWNEGLINGIEISWIRLWIRRTERYFETSFLSGTFCRKKERNFGRSQCWWFKIWNGMRPSPTVHAESRRAHGFNDGSGPYVLRWTYTAWRPRTFCTRSSAGK